MKKLLPLALGLITLLGMGLLSGCETQPLPIPTPQNILTIPDDKNVTVIWDAVDDARVTGYNVYQDGVVVNTAPIKAASRVGVKASGDPVRRLSFTVANVTTTTDSKFSVSALTATGTGPASDIKIVRPLVCVRYVIEGTDMGRQSQNIRLTKGIANLTTATVKVNGTTIPFVGSSSIYQGNLAAAVAVGGNVEILTADGDCLAYSHDTVPESAVMTAPAAGASLNVTDALPVTWTSTNNPDRFVVAATWTEGSGGLAWRSGNLAGATRTFNIPANSLPADKTVKIRVYAYNDGTESFIGAAASGSRMAIRNGDEAGRDITTTAPPPAVATNPGVSWGDPHLITFDQVAYEFQAVGEYDLGFSSDNHLRVQARHQPWGGSPYVSVNTAVATQMNGQKVGLYLNPPAGLSPLRVGNDGTRTVVPATGLDLGAGYKVFKDGPTGYKFEYPDGDTMRVEMYGSYMNIRIYPVVTRANTMKGLLGNFDGDLFNEFIKREGGILPALTTLALVREYATSWKIPTVSDSLFVYDGTEAFGGFDNSSFPSATPPADPADFAAAQADCTAAGVQPKNINGCAIDKTQTGDPGFVASAATIQQPAQIVVLEPVAPPTSSTLPGVTWGDPHLITFDQSGVEFQAVGEFDLGYSSDSQLKVQARQRPWGSSSSVSTNTAIATRMNGQKVGLYLSSAGVSPLRLGDAGTRTTVPSSGLNLGAGYSISKAGNVYTLSFPTGDRIVVGVESSYINANIYPAVARAGTMKGLLGNFDGNTTNDIFLRDGSALTPFNTTTFYGAYANSWRVPSLSDSLFVYDGSEAFGGFDDSTFPQPAPPIDPATLATAKTKCETAGAKPLNVNECAADVAITGDDGFATSAGKIQNPANDTVVPPAPKPDLAIQSATASLGSICRPNATFISTSIVVKNIGAGTAVGRSDVGVVQVVDARDEALPSGARGNAVGIPTLAPNESVTLTINIGYPTTTADDTEGLRQYVARVDLGNWYDESDETNNRFSTTLDVNVLKGHCKNRVALIHGVDDSAATVYQTNLKLKGMRVSLFPLSSLNPNNADTTLMGYDLIAIDPKTYVSSYVWEGAPGVAVAIGKMGKPMLGLGFGGSVFLEDLQGGASPIDWGSSWIITPLQQTREFTVVNAAHPAIVGPFALTITSSGKVQISDDDQQYTAAYMPVIPSGVVAIGRDSSFLIESPVHYSLAYNSANQTAIWGFNGVPNYTNNGWNALANLAWFMLP
jgi:hypothetical protein